MGHVFRHPKYYEKLKASRKLVSARTDQEAPAGASSSKPQASGTKQQAPSPKENKD
jgi:hypothetical protein